MDLRDVTIREGGQMPGREYSAEDRIAAGEALDRLGIAYIQPGFAVTGERDRRAIAALAASCEAEVVSIARAIRGDVEAALDADADVIEVFGPLSTQHLEHTVGKTREGMLAAMADAVDAVVEGGATPHLTLVDAFRTDREHVLRAFDRFPDVECIGLADTVGARTPRSVATFLDGLADCGVDLSRAGVHFHDDMGVATANALVAAERGVGTADVSVASLGERAGNSATEEVAVAGSVDADVEVGAETDRLIPVCREVLATLGEEVDPRKAVLGDEVHEHESGIHVAAMLEEPSVMEAFDPGRFGGERVLLFGEKTGRGGGRRLLELAGRDPDEDLVDGLLDALGERGPLDREAALELARDVEPVGSGN